MKKISGLFILIVIALISCKKDEKAQPSATVDVSHIAWYPDKHIAIRFSVLPDGSTGPYSINWTNPDSLVGFGPHYLKITSDINLEFILYDADNQSRTFKYPINTDTIDSLKYDYRNQYAGRYKCEVVSSYNGQSETYTDTLTVAKTTSFNAITIQTAYDVSIGNTGNVLTYLNSNGFNTYPDGNFTGYHSGAVLTSDSISYTQSGPLGYYYTKTYKGYRMH